MNTQDNSKIDLKTLEYGQEVNLVDYLNAHVEEIEKRKGWRDATILEIAKEHAAALEAAYLAGRRAENNDEIW